MECQGILKLGGKTMTPYLARLLEISLNIATIPSGWKRATVVPIYKGHGGSAVTNYEYRPASLTSVVCKQLEYIIAGYLEQVLDTNGWLYEGYHWFRPGYSCESQAITLYQDITDSLDESVGVDGITRNVPKAFDLVLHDRLLTKLAAWGVGSRVVVWVSGLLVGRTERVRGLLVGRTERVRGLLVGRTES
jgi:hypothetical protein